MTLDTSNELMLLERVFLRLGSADTDEHLEAVLDKFLPPVLLKLASPEEAVRKKVMELLIHVNRRIKTRSQVQLPMEALLRQYQDPEATSFVTNFSIIYIKLGFPRLSIEKQAELVPIVLNALENKPVAHRDSLLLLIVPLLGKVKVSTDPEKVKTLFELNERPKISKHLLEIMLDMLLLPYGALPTQSPDKEDRAVTLPVPPAMSDFSFKRIVTNNPMKPEELEEIKLGIVKFLAHGVFNNESILPHLIVAAADTRFSVVNIADNELKKIVGTLDWSSMKLSLPLYNLFLGTKNDNVKAEQKKLPASTRIRLKILTYLCRVTGSGFVLAGCISVVFDSLYGQQTNSRLKTLALNFTVNNIKYLSEEALSNIAPVLMSGMKKQVREGEESHQGQAYIIIGLLAHKCPAIVYHDVGLLEMFFTNMETAGADLKLQIREGLLNLILAYKYDIFPEEADKDGRLGILFALIKCKIGCEEPMVRFASVRTLAAIFPPDHVPSKYLLLTATGDTKDEVSSDAIKSLYGTSTRKDFDITSNKDKKDHVVLPPFVDVAKYIFNEAKIILKEKNNCFMIGNHILPFNIQTYVEVLIYLRLCLVKNVKVPQTRQILKHPCEFTPLLTEHFKEIYGKYDKVIERNPVLQYCDLIKNLLITNQAVEPICFMVELVGCLPVLHENLKDNLKWIKERLTSVREETREYIAVLYSIVLCHASQDNDFDSAIESLLEQISSGNLEGQHGAALALGSCLEMKLMSTRRDPKTWEVLKKVLRELLQSLKHTNSLIVSAACQSIGQIARVCALPLAEDKPIRNGSPDPKRPASQTYSKLDVVTMLLDVMNNTKMSVKIREKAAKSLGLLCVGENFCHNKEVLQGLLDTAKQTKDVEVHFTIGESLVMCCKGVWSPEARNPWVTLPENHTPYTTEPLPLDNLDWLLDELLTYASQPHPNARQASCIWLLAVIKGCGECEPITKRLPRLQNTFMDLLCENNDIVQDAASKGLCVVYNTYKSEELLSALVKQLTSGTRNVAQVTSDTKIFEEGQLGSAPTGGNLTTYKELCSLASDLNKPDLIYQFMHLANHNAIWNSKKGAAFGFSSIAEQCGEDLKNYLPQIVPKFYRYQYDPTPSIQASMMNIWRVLVTEPQKAVDQYYHEILSDLLDNLNAGQYRVRQSCCLALQDFLKGSANRSIHDAVGKMDELWGKLFRVMDDHHEATRLSANKTTRILSKLCIRGCDVNQGKDGVKMVEAILPPILNIGITSPVAEIRLISLETVSELVKSAGKQLKPFLPKLIPALLQATGEMESTKLSYLSTMLGAQAQAQEALDSARASFAKSHFTTETVAKSLQYADASILDELVPQILLLMKSTSGLGTRIACSHFLTLLTVHLGKDIQPFTGKFLASLVNGLTDRNSAIRKNYASAIGHLVSTAKESSLDKLFAMLQQWYFEREDDSIRSACAYTIQSIGIHNQEVLKTHSDVILPLVFFAMHAEKTPETEQTLEMWQEIWSEHSPGTETGIRQNIENICEMLKTALEQPSWTIKAQAANSVATVALKLGATMDPKHRNTLINILISGLSGRTWNGKDKLLKALASICTNCKEGILADTSMDHAGIVDAVLRESRKEEIVYKNSALQCLADVVSSLEVDKYDEVYTIVQEVLLDKTTKKDDGEESTSEEQSKKSENLIKLKETAYETLGKTWPQNSKTTQEKYREMFVEHCVSCLPSITRSVQVSVVAALYNFVDKLQLLREDELDEASRTSLRFIIDNVVKAVRYSLEIPKSTRLRKEALNVVYCLAQKLRDKKHEEEFGKLSSMFEEVLPDISNDHQPEIKSRVTDIKKILIR